MINEGTKQTKTRGEKRKSKGQCAYVGGANTEKLKRRADVCEHQRLFKNSLKSVA